MEGQEDWRGVMLRAEVDAVRAKRVNGRNTIVMDRYISKVLKA
jgi:hypothetical protein